MSGCQADRESFFEEVYRLVRSIPPGKVVTYGQVARWLGKPRGARAVGWALRVTPEGTGVPWQRVVSARGETSLKGRPGDLQKALLEAEGVAFDDSGRIDMARSGWNPGFERD